MMVTVTVVQNAKYNPDYKRFTPLVVDTINKYLPQLMKSFNIGTYLDEIVVRPIKAGRGLFTYGRVTHRYGKAKIEIDCRCSNMAKLVDTLAHEFTHAEQYNEGRLDWKSELIIGPARGQITRKEAIIWNEDGQPVEYSPNTVKTWAGYWKSPWEVEARERAAEFVKEFFVA